MFDGHRKVVICEIFDVIKSIHEKSTGHSGVRKTYEIVSLHVASYIATHRYTNVMANMFSIASSGCVSFGRFQLTI